MSKAEIRSKIIDLRHSLPENIRLLHENIIFDKLLIMCGNFSSIGVYSSIRDETSVSMLLESLLKTKKTVFLPKVCGDNLLFGRVKSYNDLSKGYMGVLEPNTANSSVPEAIIVPGVAFNTAGFRIGYGKGFYDRYLSQNECYKIGVCFDLQVVDDSFQEAHDVAMDILVTECRTVVVNR